MKEYVNPENVRLVRDAFAKKEIVGQFLPTVYVIEPSSRCNIKCVMCPNKNMLNSNYGDMPLPLFEKITQTVGPFAEFVMLYWMGEPLLHPRISEMLAIARKNIKGQIVVSTNLTEVTDEILLSLLDKSDIVLCSLDRWDPTAYERIRQGASFSSVLSNIERLIELRKPHHEAEIVVKGLDISHDSSEYKSFSEYWINRGARPLLAWLNDWAGTFPSLRKAASIPIPQVSSSRSPCADLWFKMVINWRGTIQLCCFDWEYKYPIGNCKGLDWLRSTWQSTEIQKLRRSHLQGNFLVTPMCSTCTTWGEMNEHDAYVDFNDDSYFIVF